MRRALLVGIALLAAAPAAGAASDPAPGPQEATAAVLAMAGPDSLVAAVELIYFHATLRCETCLALEANIERCLREEFAVELAEGGLSWRSLDYQDAAGGLLHAALGLRGSELVIRRHAGEGSSALPIRGVWNAPGAAAVCDSLRPVVAEYLRVQLDAEAERGR